MTSYLTDTVAFLRTIPLLGPSSSGPGLVALFLEPSTIESSSMGFSRDSPLRGFEDTVKGNGIGINESPSPGSISSFFNFILTCRPFLPAFGLSPPFFHLGVLSLSLKSHRSFFAGKLAEFPPFPPAFSFDTVLHHYTAANLAGQCKVAAERVLFAYNIPPNPPPFSFPCSPPSPKFSRS